MIGSGSSSFSGSIATCLDVPPAEPPPDPPLNGGPSKQVAIEPEKLELPEPIIDKDVYQGKRQKPTERQKPSDDETTGGLAVFISDDGTTIIKRKRRLMKSEMDV